LRYENIEGIDLLADLLRQRIQDPKYIYKDEVGEFVKAALGEEDEEFETANLPILSEADRHFRAGRWKYTEYPTSAECADKRGFTFSVPSGIFIVPAGAILPEAGDPVTVSYTWVSEQETSFRDQDLKLYIADAVNVVNDIYFDFGHSIVGSSVSDIEINPLPQIDEVSSYLYTMYATILIQREIEAGSYSDRIYVRDINITIDTSKGLGDLGRSIRELESRFQDVLNTYQIRGQEAAFAKIDTYSTFSYDHTKKYSSFVSDNSNF